MDPTGLWLVQAGVQGGGAIGAIAGYGRKLTWGYYFGRSGGRWKFGKYAQDAQASPSSGAVVGAAVGFGPVVGICGGDPASLSGAGFELGAETELSNPQFGPIPPLDWGFDAQLDSSGGLSGVQASFTLEQLNLGTDYHLYETHTSVTELVK